MKSQWKRTIADVLERVDKSDPNHIADLFMAGVIGFVIGMLCCMVIIQVLFE